MSEKGVPMTDREAQPLSEAEDIPVLRLTGEQIASIEPPVPDDWSVDWDEYEEFVPKRLYDAARQSPVPSLDPLTGSSLRDAIAAATDLTNPRLSEIEWDDVAAVLSYMTGIVVPDCDHPEGARTSNEDWIVCTRCGWRQPNLDARQSPNVEALPTLRSVPDEDSEGAWLASRGLGATAEGELVRDIVYRHQAAAGLHYCAPFTACAESLAAIADAILTCAHVWSGPLDKHPTCVKCSVAFRAALRSVPDEGLDARQSPNVEALARAVFEVATEGMGVNPDRPSEPDETDRAYARAILARLAVEAGHNHTTDGLPTYPVFRAACPLGCDKPLPPTEQVEVEPGRFVPRPRRVVVDPLAEGAAIGAVEAARLTEQGRPRE